MLIEEHKNGVAVIEFYDDYICSREESIQILQRVANNMLRYINTQENKEEEIGINLEEVKST